MAKVTTGRAGREQRRADLLDEYGATLAHMLRSQIKLNPGERMLHLGSPGAAKLAEHIATQMATGELVVCVYTYDELEETRAALAGLGNVHVINDLDDLDEGEPPFDVVSCIAPYHLGRDTVIEQIEQGVARLTPEGTFFLAGDKQHEFDRYAEALGRLAHTVTQPVTKGQYRVIAIQGRNLRKSGRIGGRRN